MKSIYILTAIILYLSNKFNAQNIGSTCILANGLNGVCTAIDECPPAAALVLSRKRPQLCEFIADTPIVCCPKNLNSKIVDSQTRFDRPECAVLNNSPLSNSPPRLSEDATLEIVDTPRRLRLERATKFNLRDNLKENIHNIAGGIRVKRTEFPHIVRLGIGENETQIEWLCGGSLISDKFILTAAHCIYSRMGAINRALLGDPESRLLQRSVQIVNNILHPNFNYSLHYHDIALSEMKDRINFRLNIQPACLYTERELPTRVPITVTGWGSTEYGGEASKYLLKADVSLFTQQECSKKYSSSLKKLQRGIDEKTQFCAGGRTEVKDTCQGDSGGPIQLRSRNMRHEQIYPIIGITSFGKICGFVNQPGVYIRIYPYLSWIESIVFNATRV